MAKGPRVPLYKRSIGSLVSSPQSGLCLHDPLYGHWFGNNDDTRDFKLDFEFRS